MYHTMGLLYMFVKYYTKKSERVYTKMLVVCFDQKYNYILFVSLYFYHQ